MATAADIAKLETKAVAAEKLIELLRKQISEVREERRVTDKVINFHCFPSSIENKNYYSVVRKAWF